MTVLKGAKTEFAYQQGREDAIKEAKEIIYGWDEFGESFKDEVIECLDTVNWCADKGAEE